MLNGNVLRSLNRDATVFFFILRTLESSYFNGRLMICLNESNPAVACVVRNYACLRFTSLFVLTLYAYMLIEKYI